MATPMNQDVLEESVAIAYDGDPSTKIGTDDLQGSSQAARKLDGGQLAIVAVELPAGSGITFPMRQWDVGDVLYFDYQTSHRVKLNCAFEDHIHCCGSADPDGKRIAFRVDVVYAGVGSKYAVPVGSPFTAEYTFAADWSLGNFLVELFDTAVGLNPGVSSIIKMKITRTGPQDTLTGTADLYVDFHDAHVEFNQIRGSRQRVEK